MNLNNSVMKTQLFILTLGFVCLFSLNSTASEKTESGKNADNISVAIPSIADAFESEQKLIIEDWMTNDDLWKCTITESADTEKSIDEEELQIENWMTDPGLWNVERRTETVENISGKGYLVAHLFNLKIEKEQPLAIEHWMVNDVLWRFWIHKVLISIGIMMTTYSISFFGSREEPIFEEQ